MDKSNWWWLKYTQQHLPRWVFEKEEQDLVFENWPKSGFFEETGLANLAYIGVEDEEKAKVLDFFQPSDSQLLDHLIEVVILNHREALFYDIVTICLDQIQLLSNAFVVTVSTVAGLDPVQSKKLIPIIEENLGSSSLDPTKISDPFDWFCRDSQS